MGHAEPENLRELLIWSTSSITAPAVEAYFREQHTDAALLDALVEIAREGEDMGDAAWAAANIIADYPAEMLLRQRAALQELSAHPWDYLRLPAERALAKIRREQADV